MAHSTLSLDRALSILHKASVGRLATCVEGQPYVVPVYFVFSDGKIYFHSASHGRKIEHIAANPNVCFQVDDEAQLLPRKRACEFTAHYYSAIVFGTAALVDNPEERLAAMRALMAKYDPEGVAPVLTPEELERASFAVVAITPTEITGVDHARL